VTASPPAPEIADPERRRRLLIGLATNPTAPPEIVARLAALPEPARAAAWLRTDLTDELANAIIDRGDPMALHSLGLNGHVPPAARQRLAAHPDPAIRAAAEQAGDFSAAAYRRFATANWDETRRHALRDPDLPAAVVGLLAHDPDRYVRCAAAGHPNLPVACLAILLNDEDDYVVECAAESSNMPVSWMYAYTEAAGL